MCHDYVWSKPTGRQWIASYLQAKTADWCNLAARSRDGVLRLANNLLTPFEEKVYRHAHLLGPFGSFILVVGVIAASLSTAGYW